MLRADVVGSLLRPAPLKEAFARFDAGELDAARLREAEDEAIRQVIGRQETIGLPVVTDGEFRRLNFQDSFGASVSGFDAAQNRLAFHEQRVAGAAPGQRWDPGYSGRTAGRRLNGCAWSVTSRSRSIGSPSRSPAGR